MIHSIAALAGRWSSLRSRKGIGTEFAWVAVGKGVEFVAAFALLKLLTNRLGAVGYGEYNLAEAALVLLHAIGLVSVHEPFLRVYHGARDRNELRAAMRTLFVGYSVVTGTVVVISTLASPLLAAPFEIHPWTICAAGLVFCFDRWRFLGIDYRNIRRERLASALHAVGFQVSLVVGLALVVWLHPTASAALFGYAAIAAFWLALGVRPLLADYRSQPASNTRVMRSMMTSFGVPFAVILVLTWCQSFGDRYLLKGLLDPRTVGLYVAAYQVSGIPYSLMFRVFHELVIPVAYGRAGDGSVATRLWAADRVLTGVFALQVVIGAAMLLVYGAFGPRLVVLLTSSEFEPPGAMILALAAARWLQHLGLALQPLFALHQRMRTLLAFRSVGAALSLGLCALGIQQAGALGAATGGALALALYLALLVLAPGGVWWLLRATRRAARDAAACA